MSRKFCHHSPPPHWRAFRSLSLSASQPQAQNTQYKITVNKERLINAAERAAELAHA